MKLRVGIQQTPYELFTIIIWTGVLYLKSDEDFLSYPFVSKAQPP
jgi:hypothetical protein